MNDAVQETSSGQESQQQQQQAQQAQQEQSLLQRMFAFHRKEFDRERVVSSPFVSTRTLFFIRACLSVYMLLVNIWSLAVMISYGEALSVYYFFTNLAYIGLTSYMVAATVHTSVAAFHKSNRYHLFDALPNFFSDVLLWLVYETAIPYAFIVTIIYWTALHRLVKYSDTIYILSDVSYHALNSAFALIEMSLNRMIMKRSHAVYFCIPPVLYACMMWMIHGIYGVFIYPFLDYGTYGGAVAGYVIGLLAGFLAVFMLFTVIHDFKDRLTMARYEAKMNRAEAVLAA
ncbi:hypothetical protein GQ42DRAFT_161352 [Ramicandelaber brevisporus]|nr:hypothetical protein GQ42DRAFT_161352 [Ramicandelaber brevisporus]